MGYEWDMDGITDEGRAEKEWRHSEGRAKPQRRQEGARMRGGGRPEQGCGGVL
ncbi:MAG: hypothetical protein J5641_03125 [Bacteroidales bacterium]|nr:hypothetical protein [Bacteroidales bacterium]